MTRTKTWNAVRTVFTVMMVVACVLGAVPFGAVRRAQAATRTEFGTKYCINAGGGSVGGADGIKLEFNKPSSGEQLHYNGKDFAFADGDMGLHLSIGGVLYTTMNGSSASSALSDSLKFDTLTVSDETGSAGTACTGTGDGSLKFTYEVTVGGLLYKLIRTVTYTAPNWYYTDEFDIVVPEGNTKKIKLYKGGDTSPGGSDQGRAAFFTKPVRDIMSVEVSKGVVLGMKEIAQETDMSTFEGAVAREYTVPYPTVLAGGNIGFLAQPGPSTHDAGFMVQYNIGDQTAGAAAATYHEEQIEYVGLQKVNIAASWASKRVSDVGRLNVTMTNAFLTAKTGLGFSITIPDPLIIGEVTNGCGGTVTQVGNKLTISGASVPLLANCLISIDVGRPTAGSTTLTGSAVTGLVGTGLANTVGSSTVNFLMGSSTFTPTLSKTPTLSATNTPTASNTVTPTNTRTPTATSTPSPIPFLMKKGAVGASFVLGLLQNNTLITWGMNKEYQTNIPPCCGSNIQDIAVGTNFALALKGGKVYGWGANTKNQLKFPASTGAGITAIAAGSAHGLALNSAGKVIAWGDNGYKQSQVPAFSKKVKSVAGGASHTVVLFTDGTVDAWGMNANKQATVPLTLKGVTQVAAGLDHNLALKSDGTIVAWGGNAYGQSTVPTNAKDVKQVSAGTQFSMAVQNNGTVLTWGRNDYNQTYIPPEYTDIFSAFAGYANTILGLRNGRVIVLGDQTNGIDASRTPTKTATPTP